MKYILLCLSFFCISSSFGSVVILNGLTHEHSLTMGGVATGKIRVQNNGTKDEKIIIYQEDLLLGCNQPTLYQKVNSHARSAGDWLTTNVNEKVLKPNEIYEVRYTINVPKKVGVEGSYWSILMIEGVNPVKEDVESGVKIDSKVRYAVQIINNVGNLTYGTLAFENISLTSRERTSRVISVKLKNTGMFLAKAKITLEIYDVAGKKIRTIKSVERKIYPEKCNDFELSVNNLPKGVYNGIVIADNGKELFGSNVSLAIE